MPLHGIAHEGRLSFKKSEELEVRLVLSGLKGRVGKWLGVR